MNCGEEYDLTIVVLAGAINIDRRIDMLLCGVDALHKCANRIIVLGEEAPSPVREAVLSCLPRDTQVELASPDTAAAELFKRIGSLDGGNMLVVNFADDSLFCLELSHRIPGRKILVRSSEFEVHLLGDDSPEGQHLKNLRRAYDHSLWYGDESENAVLAKVLQQVARPPLSTLRERGRWWLRVALDSFRRRGKVRVA